MENGINEEKLCYKATALKILGITAKSFDKLNLEPYKTVTNPWYKSGSPAKLFVRAEIERLVNSPKVLKLVPKQKRKVDYLVKFSEKYQQKNEALLEVAEALFHLNRYAKYEQCSSRMRYSIYSLKGKLIKILYDLDFCVACKIHEFKVEPKVCWGCEGYGCERCDYTGNWRDDTLIFYNFRFKIGEIYFSWHQPMEYLSFDPIESEKELTDWEPGFEGEAKEIKQTKVTEYRKLLLWFLGYEKIVNENDLNYSLKVEAFVK